MKLLYSPTSPYARKVLVVALEKGLGERIELVQCNPHVADAQLLAANPMGYLDFRLPRLDWRSASPGLRDWFTEFARRLAMIRSRPDS
jgi:glutathione S-transferase